MANGKNCRQEVTEQDVEAAIEAFRQEAEKASGKNGKPRFKGFPIHDDLKRFVMGEVLEHFGREQFSEALQKIRDARRRLDMAQRIYCARATEKHFDPMIEALLREGRLDQDLRDRVENRRTRFVEIVGIICSSANVSLDEASNRYWALEDTIASVRSEQAAREANRKKRAVEQRRKREEEEVERSREAQSRANAERRQRLEDKAAQIENGLRSVL